jgi:hypothetical protein
MTGGDGGGGVRHGRDATGVVGQPHEPHPDLGQAGLLEAEAARRGLGEVDHAVVDERVLGR